MIRVFLGCYSALTLLGLLGPKDDGIMILRNDGNDRSKQRNIPENLKLQLKYVRFVVYSEDEATCFSRILPSVYF
jgi:hypothetical protein